MKKDQTIEEKIDQAVKDLNSALLENVLASKAETEAKQRKQKAHYTLLTAKQRLTAVEMELYA